MVIVVEKIGNKIPVRRQRDESMFPLGNGRRDMTRVNSAQNQQLNFETGFTDIRIEGLNPFAPNHSEHLCFSTRSRGWGIRIDLRCARSCLKSRLVSPNLLGPGNFSIPSRTPVC
jgi:hypothetical protein